jgi:hypothetical protein
MRTLSLAGGADAAQLSEDVHHAQWALAGLPAILHAHLYYGSANYR